MKKFGLLVFVIAIALSSVAYGQTPPTPAQQTVGRWVVCIKADPSREYNDIGVCYRCSLSDSGNYNTYVNPSSPGDVCASNKSGLNLKKTFATRTEAVRFINNYCGCRGTSGDQLLPQLAPLP
jgi:hypothetical protein